MTSSLARVGAGEGRPASGQGPPTVPATLEAAGALRADVLVAATTSDETNLVVALVSPSTAIVSMVRPPP